MTKSEATKLSEDMAKELGEEWVADTYEPFRDSWVSRALKDKVSVYKSGGCYAYAATVSSGEYDELCFSGYGRTPTEAYNSMIKDAQLYLEDIKRFVGALQ